jgi:exonuclease III
VPSLNLLAWLERERPDIACLQELKARDVAYPSLAIAGAGFESLAKCQRSWNGVAILARGMKIEPMHCERKYRQIHQQALRHAYEGTGVSCVSMFVIGNKVLVGLQDTATLERAIDIAQNQ